MGQLAALPGPPTSLTPGTRRTCLSPGRLARVLERDGDPALPPVPVGGLHRVQVEGRAGPSRRQAALPAGQTDHRRRQDTGKYVRKTGPRLD